MFWQKKIVGLFRDSGKKAVPEDAALPVIDRENPAVQYLQSEFKFDDHTIAAIAVTLEMLQLPFPKDAREFIDGGEGILQFSNNRGVAVRIEGAMHTHMPFTRINDDPMILQPLGSFAAGQAIIEICPATENATDKSLIEYLKESLARRGINFFDRRISGVGLLPVKTQEFPDGTPVIIDRLSVVRKSDVADGLELALADLKLGKDPHDIYQPLRQALSDAWPAGTSEPIAEKMAAFWVMTEEFTAKGVLVPGWQRHEEGAHAPTDGKQLDAKDAAAAYDSVLAKPVRVFAPTVPGQKL